jgi:hypothetical protein
MFAVCARARGSPRVFKSNHGHRVIISAAINQKDLLRCPDDYNLEQQNYFNHIN